MYTLNASKEESLLVVIWIRFEGRTLLYLFIYLWYFSAMSTTLQLHTHLAQLPSCSSNFWLICPCVTCQGSKRPSSKSQWTCDIFFSASQKKHHLWYEKAEYIFKDYYILCLTVCPGRHERISLHLPASPFLALYQQRCKDILGGEICFLNKNTSFLLAEQQRDR